MKTPVIPGNPRYRCGELYAFARIRRFHVPFYADNFITLSCTAERGDREWVESRLFLIVVMSLRLFVRGKINFCWSKNKNCVIFEIISKYISRLFSVRLQLEYSIFTLFLFLLTIFIFTLYFYFYSIFILNFVKKFFECWDSRRVFYFLRNNCKR